MPIDYAAARKALQDHQFQRLFLEELGWDRNQGQLNIEANGTAYTLDAVAQKRGVAAYVCQPVDDGRVPDSRIRRKIERQVARYAHEHLIIFTDSRRSVQRWQWVRRELRKPKAVREHVYYSGQDGMSLLHKLERLAFTIEEEADITTTDAAGRLRLAFDTEPITRAFFDRFRKEHNKFSEFIEGITADGDRAWYASLMLNRLMFVFFIQQKRFLDNDPRYLENRLEEIQRRKGRDHFITFYRHFLIRLFHEGLGRRERSRELEELLGDVPYLNGGLFEPHEIESAYDDIQIPDAAFERVFKFFNEFDWRLDNRPSGSDREISPDVLGHIFEQYVNQQEMGAYYTKEDITAYMVENTILPFLFETAREKCLVAFESGSAVWSLLTEDPDRYIYPSLMVGVARDLPDGVGPEATESVRFSEAAKGFGLSEETWQEHLERRARVARLRKMLSSGEVESFDAFVSENLNLHQFAQDVIETSEGPELVRALYQAIKSITVLDPACGSGAFLFAALNTLEPLYTACLERMELFVAEADDAGRLENLGDFRQILGEAATHPNRDYFVLKTIIVRNLYGVDIMDEATEICMLRLFLKLVAQLEDRAEVEVLPDMDFNIQAGNSLVGFATRRELEEATSWTLDLDGTVAQIEEQLGETDALFEIYRSLQTEADGGTTKKDKDALQKALDRVRSELNKHLATQHGSGSTVDDWVEKQQPFHWFLQFHAIMQAGGFDIIVGNPPYIDVPRELDRGLLTSVYRTAMDRWSRDEDLYTFMLERSLKLIKQDRGRLAMILPLSVAFSTQSPYKALREVVQDQPGLWWFSHYDRIPSALFGNDVRTRHTIGLHARKNGDDADHCPAESSTTALQRWPTEARDYLFPRLRYARIDVDFSEGIPKLESDVQAQALERLLDHGKPLARDLKNSISAARIRGAAPDFPEQAVFVAGTAYNWFPAWREIPKTTDIDGNPSVPARTIGFQFDTDEEANRVFALLCSSLGYWWWAVASDGFNLKKWLVLRFPVSVEMISSDGLKELGRLGADLRSALREQYVYKDNRGRIGNFYLPGCPDEVAAIDDCLSRCVDGLSPDFFSDVRAFNATFSRAGGSDA